MDNTMLGEEFVESWRVIWRRGYGPLMPTAGLEALLIALREDSPFLTQGSTTTPSPLACVQDWDCEAADPIGFALWKGNSLRSVGEVEEAWARAAYEADRVLGEPAAVRHFLNWYDDTPRDEMRRELAEEVERELILRAEKETGLPCSSTAKALIRAVINGDVVAKFALLDYWMERSDS